MRGKCMGYLGGGIHSQFLAVGDHAPKQGHINCGFRGYAFIYGFLYVFVVLARIE